MNKRQRKKADKKARNFLKMVHQELMPLYREMITLPSINSNQYEQPDFHNHHALPSSKR